MSIFDLKNITKEEVEFLICARQIQEARGSKLHKKYKINSWNYAGMFQRQGGKCAICGGNNGGKSLCVDHDHATGKVRGLLCQRCNTALGHIKDNPETAVKMAEYLRKYVNGEHT